jgi:hypothetical protein
MNMSAEPGFRANTALNPAIFIEVIIILLKLFMEIKIIPK